jgi:hypothetical protein
LPRDRATCFVRVLKLDAGAALDGFQISATSGQTVKRTSTGACWIKKRAKRLTNPKVSATLSSNGFAFEAGALF